MSTVSAGAAAGKLNRSQVGQVEALWVPGRPELVRASLYFRAGMTDLGLPGAGWLHLLEHLALHGRDGISLQVNGQVGLLSLRFDVAGSAAEVSEFLDGLCGWLSGPIFDDLEHETRVLRAEGERRSVSAAARHLLWRYGASGPGIAGYDEYGLYRVTAPALAELAAEVFTAQNALLAINGEPPADLALPLPAGYRRPVPVATPCDQPLPGAFRDRVGGIGMSGVVGRSTAATVFARVLRRELQNEIRHSAGTGYSAWCEYEAVDATQAVLFTGIDVLPEARSGLVGRGSGLVRRLATSGVPSNDLTEELTQIRRGLRDDPRESWKPWSAANAAVSGSDFDPDGYDDALAAVSVADLQRVAAQFSATLLMGIDEGTNLETLPLLECPTQAQLPAGGTTYPALGNAADVAELRVQGGSVFLRRGRRVISAEPAGAAAVLGTPDGRRVIIRPDGYQIEIEATLWRDGNALVSAIDELTPPAVRVPLPERAAADIPKPAPKPRVSWQDRLLRAASSRVAVVLAVVAFAAMIIFTVAASHRDVPPVAPVAGGVLLIRMLVARKRLSDRKRGN